MAEVSSEAVRRVEVGREVVGDCSAICPHTEIFEGQARVFRIKYQDRAGDDRVLREQEERHCEFWRDNCQYAVMAKQI